MSKWLFIALGGALGSVLRHWLAGALQAPPGEGFPWGTLVVNATGCFAIGVLATVFAGAWPVREDVRLAILAGLLGGYTTYSTFAQQTVDLARQGQLWAAGAYVLATNLLCIGGAAAGWAIGRGAFPPVKG